MTRNGFMKMVNGNSKFCVDPQNCYETAVKRYEAEPEKFANTYLDNMKEFYNEHIFLIRKNAEGEAKNYLEISPKINIVHTPEGNDFVPVPDVYSVYCDTAYNVDNGISERLGYFEINEEDLSTLMRKHELHFGA